MNAINLANFKTITAEHEAGGLSGKYAFVPTLRVAEVFQSHGWLPVKVQEQRCNKEERRGFQKHVIRFRRENGTPMEKDALFPEIVLINSHDGLASFKLMAGLFRLVCLNGLTIADATFSSHSIKHIGYTDQAVSMAIEDICDNVPRIMNRVHDYQAIDLHPTEQGAYAMAALVAKYGEEEARVRDFDIPSIVKPIRSADSAPTLWNTFNTVQERLIKGRMAEMVKGRVRKARRIASVSEDIRINRALWTLAEEMAKIKGA